jgi:hypothetical protein
LKMKPVTKTQIVANPLDDRVTKAALGLVNPPNQKELMEFKWLLKKCLLWNPDKRMKPKDAATHPFFGQAKKAPVIKPAFPQAPRRVNRK